MQDHKYIIEKCRQLAEKKINLGESSNWKNQDFEILSDQILEETGVNLSVATLKRIWGKVRYDSKPNITTLNTLAKFVGYQNWGDYSKSQFSPGVAELTNGPHAIKNFSTENINNSELPHRTGRVFLIGRKSNILLFSIVGLSLLFFASFLMREKKKNVTQKYDANKFSFSSKKVISKGVPNSVIFNYDAQAALPGDTILIQQSWDKKLQQQVPYDRKSATSIYYYPGFFKAKLLVNNQVVKEHDLLIQTNGWLALAEREAEVPVYYDPSDVFEKGSLTLSLDKIKASNIPLQPEAPIIAYYNVSDFNGLSTDDFKFETELKNIFREGSGVCQKTEVLLLCEENFISIPLAAKGCVADLELSFLGNQKDGKKEDLSKFGCDFTKWVRLSCQVKNKQCTIHINNELVYESTSTAATKKISGIVFRFKGTGSVNYVRLSKPDGQVAYEDDF